MDILCLYKKKRWHRAYQASVDLSAIPNTILNTKHDTKRKKAERLYPSDLVVCMVAS